jgi:hypothetical protein
MAVFIGKMYSDWFNVIEILQGRWQHGEKVGYCYPSGLEKTLCKRHIYVPLVTKGLSNNWYKMHISGIQFIHAPISVNLLKRQTLLNVYY